MGSKTVSRRAFFKATATSSAGLVVAPSIMNSSHARTQDNPKLPNIELEWRNKQEGMFYRQLGRTGMMVSEIGMGTFPFDSPEHLKLVEAGVERGLNYLDTAQAYSGGKVEKTLGEYLKFSKNREKVFLTTKLSNYYTIFNHYVKEIEKELTSRKLEDLKKAAETLIEERRVLTPGYYFNFFGGQQSQIEHSYYKHLLLKEYGYKSGLKSEMKNHAITIFEGSLKNLQTDYIDVLFCPHGVSMPEFLEDEVIREVFAELKQQGKIRASAVSFHNDVTGNLLKAVDVGHYDVAMFAYNIANHAGLEHAMSKAHDAGMGLLAMKVVKLFADKGTPNWMLEKLNATVPDQNYSVFTKSYLWALRNSNLSACVSQMETEKEIEENLLSVGKRLENQAM